MSSIGVKIARTGLSLGCRASLGALALSLWLHVGPQRVVAEDVGLDAARIAVRIDGAPAMVYQGSAYPKKPYVAELFSPAGVNILRDSPVDHKHHHSLMFAVAVDGVNFWAESDPCGTQEPQALPTVKTVQADGVAWQVLSQGVVWRDPAGKPMVEEKRSVAVARTGQPLATLLCWQSVLALPEGKPSAMLSGSPYFGLGMRWVQSMDAGGRFFNADGQTGVEGTNNARSAWCAYTAAAAGKAVTVAVFDWPRNARHPATWFTMASGFAYMSATLNLSKEPLELSRSRPLELRYGVAVWDGQVEPGVVENLYRRWVVMAGQEPSNP